MTTRMRTLMSSTLGGAVLLAAAAGLAGGPHGLVQQATRSAQASTVGYQLGNHAATGGGGQGWASSGGGTQGMTSTGGRGDGVTATGGGAQGLPSAG